MTDHDTDDGRLPEGPTAGLIAADAPPGDTYGREHAAKILGVSPRRISQLADEGRFNIVQRKPLRLSAESVHAMREHRRSRVADIRATVPPADQSEVSTGLLAEVRRIAEIAESANRRALESGDDMARLLREELDRARTELDAERDRADRLRTELDAERDRRIEAEQKRRRLF